MPSLTSHTTALVLLLLSGFPSFSYAEVTRLVSIRNNTFFPSQITIQAGDTVHWTDYRYENEPHNVAADDGTFSSRALFYPRGFSFTFTEAGEYSYHCLLHPGENLGGTITVEGSLATPFDIDPGHSGNWWNGPARSGEGVQIEVSDGGDGELVFVVTIYAYGPEGGQIFLVGVGTPESDIAQVDVYITGGGLWGDDFDPDEVVETQWGTGTFTASSCGLIHMTLAPNLTYEAEGYTSLEYDLVRLTTPAVACPLGN